MQNLIFPLVYRNSPSRTADKVAVTSGRSTSAHELVGDTGRLSHLTVYRNPGFGCVDRLKSTDDVNQKWLPVTSATAHAKIILEDEANSTCVSPEARRGRKLPKASSFAGDTMTMHRSPYRMEFTTYVLLSLALGGTCWLLTELLIHLLTV